LQITKTKRFRPLLGHLQCQIKITYKSSINGHTILKRDSLVPLSVSINVQNAAVQLYASPSKLQSKIQHKRHHSSCTLFLISVFSNQSLGIQIVDFIVNYRLIGTSKF